MGRAVDIQPIVEYSRDRGIRIIEDCSQAHGARINGRLVGTFGDIAAFSTMYRKASITGASGGVVFTTQEETYHKVLLHADRGKPTWTPNFQYNNPKLFRVPALNFHTDEISCAIGIASSHRLDQTIQRRLAFVKSLDGICDASEICAPSGWSEGDSPFSYPIMVDTDRISVSKTEFALAIRAEGVDLNPHYEYLVCDWPYVTKYLDDHFTCPNARRMIETSFNLFVNERYGPNEAQDTIAAVSKVTGFFASN